MSVAICQKTTYSMHDWCHNAGVEKSRDRIWPHEGTMAGFHTPMRPSSGAEPGWGEDNVAELGLTKLGNTSGAQFSRQKNAKMTTSRKPT